MKTFIFTKNVTHKYRNKKVEYLCNIYQVKSGNYVSMGTITFIDESDYNYLNHIHPRNPKIIFDQVRDFLIDNGHVRNDEISRIILL